MAIKWGNTTVTVVKWGSTTCTAVYWGSTKVFTDALVDAATFTFNIYNDYIGSTSSNNYYIAASGGGAYTSIPGSGISSGKAVTVTAKCNIKSLDSNGYSSFLIRFDQSSSVTTKGCVYSWANNFAANTNYSATIPASSIKAKYTVYRVGIKFDDWNGSTDNWYWHGKTLTITVKQ